MGNLDIQNARIRIINLVTDGDLSRWLQEFYDLNSSSLLAAREIEDFAANGRRLEKYLRDKISQLINTYSSADAEHLGDKEIQDWLNQKLKRLKWALSIHTRNKVQRRGCMRQALIMALVVTFGGMAISEISCEGVRQEIVRKIDDM